VDSSVQDNGIAHRSKKTEVGYSRCFRASFGHIGALFAASSALVDCFSSTNVLLKYFDLMGMLLADVHLSATSWARKP
jgi:hypothetical protein